MSSDEVTEEIARLVVVALVVVELPVMTRLPFTVEEAVERKPARVESPEAERVVKEAAPPVIASAPTLIEPKLEVMEPESSAPTDVREEVRTPVPRVLLERTLVPLT